MRTTQIVQHDLMIRVESWVFSTIQMPTRDSLQSDFARDLSRLSSKHRRELERHLGRPPNINNVPPEFWAKVQQQTEDEIASSLLLIFLLIANSFGVDRGKATVRAQAFASRRSIDIGARFIAHTQDRIARASRIWVERANGDLPISRDDVKIKTASVLGPTRAANIAATEATEASTQAMHLASADQTERTGRRTTLIWRLDPACNHCTFCPLVAGTNREFWQQFIGGPPAHPGCCCSLFLAPFDEPTKREPSTGAVVAAARRSNVFGF